MKTLESTRSKDALHCAAWVGASIPCRRQPNQLDHSKSFRNGCSTIHPSSVITCGTSYLCTLKLESSNNPTRCCCLDSLNRLFRTSGVTTNKAQSLGNVSRCNYYWKDHKVSGGPSCPCSQERKYRQIQWELHCTQHLRLDQTSMHPPTLF